MSVIAWDGKTIAADTMQVCADMRSAASKLMRVHTLAGFDVIGWCGDNEQGLLLARWYQEGADPGKWPEFQKTDSWTRLVVASRAGLSFFEKLPVAQVVRDPYMAFGSGRDYAMGAMAMGATAAQAVECAIKHCISTGGTVQSFAL